MPISIIMEDLRVTRSVEHTVENIIEERLVAPVMFHEPEPNSTANVLLQDSAAPVGSVPRNWDELSSIDNVEMLVVSSRFLVCDPCSEHVAIYILLHKFACFNSYMKELRDSVESSSRHV